MIALWHLLYNWIDWLFSMQYFCMRKIEETRKKFCFVFNSPITGCPLVRKCQGNFIFLHGQGILQNGQGNFKYQKKSGNFLILAQNCLTVVGILSLLSD